MGGRYSLRGLKNFLYSRPDFKEESLDFEGVKRFLGSMDHSEGIEVGIVYYHPKHKLFGKEDINPSRALFWVSKTFAPLERFPFQSYFDCTHQTYSGKKSEKHYITLSRGVISKKWNKEVREPIRKADLEFIIHHHL
jgi:hypothetical protein